MSRYLGSPVSYEYAEPIGASLFLSFLSLCGPGHSGYTKALNPGTQSPLAAWESSLTSKDPHFISAFEIKTLRAFANVGGIVTVQERQREPRP